ncbi:hypothetical protein NUW58_g10029 [Xylaria curta]|uniref:Uncharacterized protein n=1 Tax=Xylaria curta TaxID=42375 RepID=A0ACC1MRF5_9PEZI|nr:hypothetical protein NUW58_g10029 [Xylaria curta]
MPFPIHQERDVPQQKGLSSSRLRERRRESRELEQISSFFLPVGADAPQCKAKPARLKCNEEDKSSRLNYSDNASRDSFGTPSSPSAPAQSHRQPAFVSQESHFSAPAAALSNTDCRPTSSTATTYFTWPSSQYSPKASKCLVDTQPDSTEPAQPPTPDNIREALAATGVYKDTGIHHYVSLNDQKTRIFEIRQESPSTHSSVVNYVDSEEGQTPATNQKSKLKPKHSDSTRAIMARLAHVEKRWNTILPPEWRLHRSSAVNVPLTIEEPASVVLGLPTSTKPSNCQEIALEALAKPSQGSHPAQLSSRYGKEDYESNPNSTSKGLVPAIPEPDSVVDHASTADNDRASIASRDAMPPPPIPLPRIDSLHPTNPKPRDDTSSPICIGTTMPLETQAQIPKYEHRQWTDTYETTSKLRELSNEPGKVIPTLDLASWIPQVKTPSITCYNRDKNFSEQSMKPPLYRSQGREEIPQVAAHLNPPYTTDITESIADFIARIESEFEESTSLDKFCQPESIIENPELSFNPIVSTRDTQDQKSIAPEGFQIEHRQLPIDGPEFGLGEVLELDPSFHEYQKPVVSINHRPTTMPAEDLVDDNEEFLEMSSFWRPNRFSNF